MSMMEAKRFSLPPALARIEPGWRLTPAQSQELGGALASLVEGARLQRGGAPLSRDGLRKVLGRILRSTGLTVREDVGYNTGWPRNEVHHFDLVLTVPGEEEFNVIEVRGEVTAEELERVARYIGILRRSNLKAQLFVGTDILHYPALTSGALGDAVKALMVREPLGLVLADEGVLVAFDNYPRLALAEMPQFVFPKE